MPRSRAHAGCGRISRRTVNGRRYDPTGVDLTAAATIALNAAAGGGPVDWQSRLPEGTEQFLAATRIGSTEAGLAVEFREAMSAVTDTGAYQFASVWANVGVESLPIARSVQLWNQRTAEGQGTLGTWGEMLAFNVPLLSGIGEGVYTATSGRDCITGEQQSNFARALSGAGAAAEALPFAGSTFRAGRKAAGNIAQASLKASRSTAHALVDAGRYVRSGARQLSDVTQGLIYDPGYVVAVTTTNRDSS